MATHSCLSNALGCLRANMSERARRWYERRCRQDTWNMEERMEGRAEASRKLVAPYYNIGVVDTFMGNLQRSTGEDGKDVLGGRASEGDIAGMNEDQYSSRVPASDAQDVHCRLSRHWWRTGGQVHHPLRQVGQITDRQRQQDH